MSLRQAEAVIGSPDPPGAPDRSGRRGPAAIDVATPVAIETDAVGAPAGVRPTVRDRPFAPQGRLTVLYDDECGFCRWVVRRLARWDGRGRLEFVPLRDSAASGRPLLEAASRTVDLAAALTVVDAVTGQAARGGDAFLTLVDALPGGRILRPAWSDPPFLWAVRTGYRLAARHRSRLAALGFDAPAMRSDSRALGSDAAREPHAEATAA